MGLIEDIQRISSSRKALATERIGEIQKSFKRLETMERLMSKKYWVIIILSGILLFHFVNNFIWLKKDNFIRGIDANWHLIEAVQFQIAFKEIAQSQAPFFTKTEQWIQTFRNWHATPNWPPLIYFLSALIDPQEIHLFSLRMYVNFIFYTLLILSLYFLGKKCFNRRVGLIAAFLISFYPAVCAFSRQFGLDFPLLCLTSVCLCLLVYSENFSKRGYSLLFGVSLGLGTLVKLQIMIFLLVPLLYAILGVFRQKRSEKLNGSLNFVLSSTIAFSLFYLYWGNKIGAMLRSLHDHVFIYYPFYTAKPSLVSGASIPILNFRSMAFYLEGLLVHVYLLPLILFIGALTALLVSKNKWRFFYAFSFSISYLIISFISVKWIRYALPLLVFMAVITGWLIDNLRSKHFKIALLGLLVFYSMSFYFLNSWTHKIYELIPRHFLKLTSRDSAFSNPYPPNSFDYVGELKKSGIIPYIEQKAKEGKAIRIKFNGYNIEDPFALLCVYFQDAILNGQITMQKEEASDFQDAGCVFIRDADFLNKKDLLENYRVLSRVNGSVFLIKNEKSSFI